MVDGNNVMGQRVGWHRDRAGARRRLAGELERFAEWVGEAVEVVLAPQAAPPANALEAANARAVARTRVSLMRRTSILHGIWFESPRVRRPPRAWTLGK